MVCRQAGNDPGRTLNAFRNAIGYAMVLPHIAYKFGPWRPIIGKVIRSEAGHVRKMEVQ